MRKIRIIDVNVPVVKRIFHLRFWVAGLTRKSRAINKIVKKMLFENDGTFFVPNNKSVTKLSTENIEMNFNVESPDKIVMPTDIIKSFIMESDDIVIMNKCLCRYSTDCNDYPIDLGCIFVGKTTRKISRKYCHKATQEEALEHIDKCDEAGLMHIVGRNKMDTVWMGVGPGDELLTICNCCPCCCLWRVYPNLSNTIQNDFYKLPGVNLKNDSEACIGCGKCIEVCYANAISLESSKAIINNDICIGCGNCCYHCPVNAIELEYDNRESYKVFDKLHSLVNVKSN